MSIKIMKNLSTRDTSPHSWMIMLMIIMTMGVFLYILVSTVSVPPPIASSPMITNGPFPSKKKTLSPSSMDTTVDHANGADHLDNTKDQHSLYSSSHHILYDNATNTPVTHTQLLQFSSDWMKRYFASLPKIIRPSGAMTTDHPATANKTDDDSSITTGSWMLGTTAVSSAEVMPSQFFIYDTKIVFDPKTSSYMFTLLMDLPPIRISISPIYSKYYPEINPYIHTIELTYSWKFIKTTGTLLPTMTLSSMKISPVPWETNRYYMMYIQTKNSPLCLPDMIPPVSFTEEELKSFLLQTEIFSVVNTNSPPSVDIISKPLPSSTKTFL